MLVTLILIAIVQGITEFLPVSSSGHLAIIAKFLHFETSETMLFFLVVHAGTAVAALYYFWNDIMNILLGIKDLLTNKKTNLSQDAIKWIILIFMVSLPTGITGIFFRDVIENLGANPLGIPIALMITAIILLITKFTKSRNLDLSTFTYKQAFLVGIAQSFALMPGISRSGATIAMALILGATPLFAGKLSFLASFVAIFGALLLEIVDFIKLGSLELPLYDFIIGFVIAFVVGLWALKFLIKILSDGKLYLFSFYCFAISCILWILYFYKIWI